MLLPYTTLIWYGPGAVANVVPAPAQVVVSVKGDGRLEQVVNAAATVPLAKATRLRGQPMVTTGAGSLVQALPKGRARPGIVIRVNTLSQDDVTGAVLESEIEAGFSLRKMLRLMGAVLLGKSTGGPGNPVFRDVNDIKARVTGTADSNGNRSAVTYDPN
jgi:hypothetical protein